MLMQERLAAFVSWSWICWPSVHFEFLLILLGFVQLVFVLMLVFNLQVLDCLIGFKRIRLDSLIGLCFYCTVGVLVTSFSFLLFIIIVSVCCHDLWISCRFWSGHVHQCMVVVLAQLLFTSCVLLLACFYQWNCCFKSSFRLRVVRPKLACRTAHHDTTKPI